LGEEKRVHQSVEDQLSDAVTVIDPAEQPLEELSIFSLSAGIMKPAAKTANRIDGVLARMLLEPGTGRYLQDVDKNLDYLFTSLQLDMINMAAEDIEIEPRPRRDSAAETVPDVKLVLGPPLHDDARES
jgi:hypothetical protein